MRCYEQLSMPLTSKRDCTDKLPTTTWQPNCQSHDGSGLRRLEEARSSVAISKGASSTKKPLTSTSSSTTSPSGQSRKQAAMARGVHPKLPSSSLLMPQSSTRNWTTWAFPTKAAYCNEFAGCGLGLVSNSLSSNVLEPMVYKPTTFSLCLT